MPLQKMTGAAFFAAIIAVLSQFAIPIGSVPHTLQVLAVTLAGVVMGPRYGAVSVIVWILLGGFGLPVFAMGQSGLGILFGPLCGFFPGFIMESWICGFCRPESKHWILAILMGIVSLLAVYIVGIGGFAAYFTWALHKPMTVFQAAAVCAAPFIPFDLIKMVLGILAGSKISDALNKAGFHMHK